MNKNLFGETDAPNRTTGTLGRREHLTFRGNLKKGRHGWLRLTPAYSLHIVREILEQCGPNEVVLDPFSGTGTTSLASASMGIPCHAVDINPFLVWLGNLKLTIFDDGTTTALQRLAGRIVATLRRRTDSKQPWVPDIHKIEKWWDASSLDALARLFERIQKTRATAEPHVLDLLNIAFCRVMIQTAHVSFAHQSMSFKKPRESAQLPLLRTMEDPYDAVWTVFLDEVSHVSAGIETDTPSVDARVFQGDSRDPSAVLPRSDYTTVITSPPYPNRMSYIRELRPYMYWLGHLTNGRQAGELDWQAIGGTWGCATSMLGTWAPASDSGVPFPKFDRIIASIAEEHELLARYVHKYFEDIGQHIENLGRVLCSGARCHYIVGNSKFYGTLLPVEEIYAALFEDAGFGDVTIETIRKRNSKKELYEYTVCATRP